MSKLMVIAPVLLAASYAAHAGDIPVAPVKDSSTPPATAPASGTPVDDTTATTAASPDAEKIKVVEMTDFMETRVCEQRPRTGSRIVRSVCYSRETYAAMQQARRDQALRHLDALEFEQRMMAIQQRESQEQQRRQMAR